MNDTPDQPHLPAMDDWEPPESSQSKFERDNRDCEYWSAEMGECSFTREWCDEETCQKRLINMTALSATILEADLRDEINANGGDWDEIGEWAVKASMVSIDRAIELWPEHEGEILVIGLEKDGCIETTETMTMKEAIKRWPDHETEIRAAVVKEPLPWEKETDDAESNVDG